MISMCSVRWDRNKLYTIAGVLVTTYAVGLVWYFRFLPLYDLPIWMYETRIFGELVSGVSAYSECFEIVLLPVPNIGLTLLLWLLSSVFSIEHAGKVFLTLCVVGFPWSWRYVVQRLCGKDSPFAYLGFPYSFSLFFFKGQASLMGLGVALLILSYIRPRISGDSKLSWVVLSVALTLLFFVHAVPWFVLLTAVAVLTIAEGGFANKIFARFALAATPGLVFLGLHIATRSPRGYPVSHWGVKSIAQNIFKPLGLVTKSFGLETGWPLTLFNVGWLICLFIVFAIAIRRKGVRNCLCSPWSIPAGILVILVVVLPDFAFGLWEPGGRFVFPALLFLIFAIGNIPGYSSLRLFFVIVAILVLVQATIQFGKVNFQMNDLDQDLARWANPASAQYAIRYDWSAEQSFMTAGAASVDPLSLVPYYVLANRGGMAWIHGTSLLRLKDECGIYQPLLSGRTRSELFGSFMDHRNGLHFFPVIVILGEGVEVEETTSMLVADGYRACVRKRLWTILSRNVD